MRLRILLVCIVIVLSGSSARRAAACTCGVVTVAEYLGNAKAVFVGGVISKRGSDAVEEDGAEVTLKFERVWKGRIAERAVVHTGATNDMYPFLNLCATPFRVGETYLMFA